jgi:hypothetical protein
LVLYGVACGLPVLDDEFDQMFGHLRFGWMAALVPWVHPAWLANPLAAVACVLLLLGRSRAALILAAAAALIALSFLATTPFDKVLGGYFVWLASLLTLVVCAWLDWRWRSGLRIGPARWLLTAALPVTLLAAGIVSVRNLPHTVLFDLECGPGGALDIEVDADGTSKSAKYVAGPVEGRGDLTGDRIASVRGRKVTLQARNVGKPARVQIHVRVVNEWRSSDGGLADEATIVADKDHPVIHIEVQRGRITHRVEKGP